EQRPERIVSLSPTATETLFAIDAGAQVVAADEFSNYPAQAPRTDLSGYQPNAEAVATYQPDLVVVVDDLDGIVGQLSSLGIPTYVAPSATNLDDVYAQITDLGALTGHAAEAEALVNRMRDDIAKLIADLPQRDTPLTYYYELDNNYYSVTSNTFVGTLLSNAGLVNIADAAADSTDYPKLSAEVILNANPDLIFLADASCCGESAETVAARPGWGNLKAVTNGNVVELDSDIASRWGPRVVDLQRVIVEAAAQVPVG
ncbi:MAG TPA: ABC transporter substrate-binding protein, partial [Micromonosporaceae bacterium]|nr:ABC transporter substrate-binding protein [Micromonosporaceae bacterium]